MEYTSKAVGNAALTTGIIGTALGALTGAGGLAGVLGIGPRGPQPSDPGDRPVTRYEMGLIQDINAKNDEITLLKSQQYADAKADVLQAQINQTSVWTAGATATMGFMNQQIQQLFGITKLGIPAGNIIEPVVPPTAEVTSSSASTNG